MTTTQKEKKPSIGFTLGYPVEYCNILVPRAFKKNGVEQGAKKYGAKFLVDQAPVMKTIDGKEVDMSDLARLKREVIALLRQHVPAGKKMVTGRRMTQEELDAGTVEVNVPWSDGTAYADKGKAEGKNCEYARGKAVVKGSSTFPIAMAYVKPGTKVAINVDTPELAATMGEYFYSGAHLMPTFSLKWYKGDAGKPDGVTLYLDVAVFIRHGTRIGTAQKNAAETFKNYVGSISAEDPTGGAANEQLEEDEFSA